MTTDSARLVSWNDVHLDQLLGTVDRRFVHSDALMISQITIHPGSRVPPHRHANEQWTYVLQGSMVFVFGEDQSEEMTVVENQIVHIPANLLHSATSVEGCFELDIFSPPRQDWIEGSDGYLRGGGEAK